MASVNKAELIELYLAGNSLPDITRKTGVPMSTARHHIKAANILRPRSDAVALAFKSGKQRGRSVKGQTRSDETKKKMSESKVKYWEGRAKGVSLKPNGYVEFTRGPHKGKSVHTVKMENKIGRKLRKGECVHHIDHNRSNNEIDNLQLMTRSAHSKMHILERLNAKKGLENGFS